MTDLQAKSMTDLQAKLFDFVKRKHADQKRKYTGDPYHTHLYNVAELVNLYEPNCYEIALCHDLFEDTSCNFTELYKVMTEAGYSRNEAYDVCTCVTELTDVYTAKDYPYFNRAKRKQLEATRLGKISPRSMNVKYADLIDNTASIIAHDTGFAKIYLKEKSDILLQMTGGNKALRDHCIKTLTNELEAI